MLKGTAPSGKRGTKCVAARTNTSAGRRRPPCKRPGASSTGRTWALLVDRWIMARSSKEPDQLDVINTRRQGGTNRKRGRPKSLSPGYTSEKPKSTERRQVTHPPGSATQAAALSGSEGPGDKNQHTLWCWPSTASSRAKWFHGCSEPYRLYSTQIRPIPADTNSRRQRNNNPITSSTLLHTHQLPAGNL